MAKTVAIIQARSESTRLPNKVAMKIGGKSILEHCIYNVAQAVDDVRIAVPYNDDSIKETARGLAQVITGPMHDVLHRYWLSALDLDYEDTVVRVTSDCPFIDTSVLRESIEMFEQYQPDYYSSSPNVEDMPGYPKGTTVELVKVLSLYEADMNLPFNDPYREHVTQALYTGPGLVYNDIMGPSMDKDYRKYDYSIDTEKDYWLLCQIYQELGKSPKWEDIVNFMDRKGLVK